MLQKEFPREPVDMDVSIARDQHHALITKLMTGPGGSEDAMHRAERMFALPYWAQFGLRYKKRATPAFIEKVRQAYVAMLQQSVRRDLERLKTEQTKGNGNADIQSLIAEAEDLLNRLARQSPAQKVER